MYHSVTIGNKNTYDDWHLIAPNRLFVVAPSPRTNYIDILGKNGSLDYTEALTKLPRFSDRVGSWDFVVLNPGDINDYPDTSDMSRRWPDLYSELMFYFRARHFDRVVLDDDPDYYYSGRVWVSNWQMSSGWSQVTLSYHFSPFKKRLDSTGSSGVVEFNYREIHPSNAQTIEFEIPSDIVPVQLHLKCTSTAETIWGVSLEFQNEELEIDFSTVVGGSVEIVGNEKYYVFPSMLLSNLSGSNTPTLRIGPSQSYPEESYDLGPIRIEYWWEEERL